MRFGQCRSLTPSSERISKLMLLLVRRFDPNQFCRTRRPFAIFRGDAPRSRWVSKVPQNFAANAKKNPKQIRAWGVASVSACGRAARRRGMGMPSGLAL